MAEQNQHWTNQVETIENQPLINLKQQLNTFYKDRFVIATQVFPKDLKMGRLYDAIIYYKTPPENKNQD